MEQELSCLNYMAQADSALANYKEAYQHMVDYAMLYQQFSNDKTAVHLSACLLSLM